MGSDVKDDCFSPKLAQKDQVVVASSSSKEDSSVDTFRGKFDVNVENFPGYYDQQHGIFVTAASASYSLKGEDRYAFVDVSTNRLFSECQESEKNLSDDKERRQDKMIAFAGVFDGHDGAQAAEYCSKGLLNHILLETTAAQNNDESKEVLAETKSKDFDKPLYESESSFLREHNCDSKDALDFPEDEERKWWQWMRNGYQHAFHSAQEQFAYNDEFHHNHQPPTFEDVKNAHKDATECINPNLQKGGLVPRRLAHYFRKRRYRKNHSISNALRGGTTACTLSIYSRVEPTETKDSQGERKSSLYAIVANCGDSRLLTDDGTKIFRQVTSEHKPSDKLEAERLRICQDRNEGYVFPFSNGNPRSTVQVLRICPGGLAVSRSIGDVHFSRAVIPIPDVYYIDLLSEYTAPEECAPNASKQSNNTLSTLPITRRFVIASDGLFDSLSMATIKMCASKMKDGKDGNKISPKDTASNLVKQALKVAGNLDDITVLVIDVTAKPTNSEI